MDVQECRTWIAVPLPLPIAVDVATGLRPAWEDFEALRRLDERVRAGETITFEVVPWEALEAVGHSPQAIELYAAASAAFDAGTLATEHVTEFNLPHAVEVPPQRRDLSRPIRVLWLRAEDLCRWAVAAGFTLAPEFVEACKPTSLEPPGDPNQVASLRDLDKTSLAILQVLVNQPNWWLFNDVSAALPEKDDYGRAIATDRGSVSTRVPGLVAAGLVEHDPRKGIRASERGLRVLPAK